MSKRLYEVARELDISSAELTERIDSLGLKFKVQNHLTVLTDEQIDELRRRMADGSGGPAEEKVLRSGVIRRRSRRRKVVGGEDGVEDVGPVPDREEESDEAAVAAEAPAEAPAPAAADEGVVRRSRDRFATVVTPKPEVEAPAEAPVEEPVAAEAPAEAAPVEEPVAAEAPAEAAPVEEPAAAETEPEAEAPVRRNRFATVHTRSEPVVAEAEEVDEPVESRADATASPARSRFATVHTTDEAALPSTPSPMEMAALARREADQQAQARTGRGGARVVGMVSQEQLSERMRDKPVPGPGPVRADRPDRRNKKKGRRVVESRNLYTGSRRRQKGKKGMGGGAPQQPRITQAAEHKRVVKMEEAITLSDLAQQMSIKAGELAMKLMFELGMKGANINTTIDYETAELLTELYGYKIEQVGFDINKYLPQYDDDPEKQISRPPVVTVMGHVDHGKTSVLDKIRETTIAAGEAGGITQHIGAYSVHLDSGDITFLDTPGHEAFTALRARGAQATDLVVLVVAADDGVMPQTAEAINHSRDAGVPIIVAVNKIDKPGANSERVKQALTEYELVPEEWGGDTLFVETSALTGQGIDELLESINLQAEVLELKSNPDRMAEGLVVESKLDVGRGPVATVLVQQGTLKQGDTVVIGQYFGRVRTMTDENGKRSDSAGPSTPVEITGLNGVPTSGESFYVVREEKDAKVIAEHIGAQNKQVELAQSVAATGGLEGIADFIKAGKLKELKVIVKGDVQGSVEALSQALVKLATDEVKVRIVHQAVGGITENDVNLAASSGEDVGVVIIGFNVRPESRAQAAADNMGIVIFTHSIIYEIIDRVRDLMTGLLEPVYVEELLGKAEVRAIFSIPRVGTVAGCMITEGHMERNGQCRVVRDSIVVYESTISSLRRFEEDVKEVKTGFECGLSVERFNDVKVGDVIECFRMNETAATL